MFSAMKYMIGFNVVGRTVLKYNRIKDTRRLKKARWNTDILAPPLDISPWTKELISKHYTEGRFVEGYRPVAWVTSGAPIEFLRALGYYLIYPENHGALCGTRRVAVELSEVAESAGYSRDICSYARTDIGSVLSGKTPVGKLPRPNLLVTCTNICQTVLYWYQVLAEYFRVPLIIIDTPFIYTDVQTHAVEYVKRQVEKAIEISERVAKKPLSHEKLREVVELSKEAAHLWLEIVNRCRHKPAPITVFDQFIHMAPVVEMRGDRATIEFYRKLLTELDWRIENGIGAVKNEKKRLLWDNLPIWYRLRFLGEYLGKKGIAVVVSTYTNAWGELAPHMDPSNPIESIARVYLNPILNRGTGYKLGIMKKMVKDFEVDGVILHSDRSCKPYSIGQIDQRGTLIEKTGVPSLLLESDHADPRAFSEEQALSRLDSFLEILGV